MRAMPSSMPLLPKSTTNPPLAMAGTVPPYRMETLDLEMSELRGHGGRNLLLASAVAALLAGGYVERNKLTSLVAMASASWGSASLASTPTANLRASAKQQGIMLVVDGKAIGVLPQELKGLPPGEHTIAFEGGDRYAPQKSTMIFGQNETKELGPVSLKVSKGLATFDVKTAGASLSLVSADDRRELSDYSHPIDIENSKSWTLEATKPGFKTVKVPLTFEDQAAKTFVVALSDPDKPSATADAPASPQPPSADVKPAKAPVAVAVAAKPAPVEAPKPEAPKAEAPKAAPAAGGNCTLNFNSIPASRIAVDGRPIGMTPKMGISVTPGSHTVMFVSDTAKKVTVASCKPGEQKTLAVRLTQ
jgi:serine/threonine-protein kinase